VTGTDPATNPSSLSWDVAWRGDLIYLFDMSRGVEILRWRRPVGLREAADRPRARKRADPLAAVPVSGLTPGSLVSPVFEVPGPELMQDGVGGGQLPAHPLGSTARRLCAQAVPCDIAGDPPSARPRFRSIFGAGR
jgi:hypothetical protein